MLVVVAVWRCCPFCDTPLNDCVLLLLMLLDEEEVANVLLPLVVVDVLDVVVLLPVEAALADDFFHGWNPLPTAASDKGGGILDDTFAALGGQYGQRCASLSILDVTVQTFKITSISCCC